MTELELMSFADFRLAVKTRSRGFRLINIYLIDISLVMLVTSGLSQLGMTVVRTALRTRHH